MSDGGAAVEGVVGGLTLSLAPETSARGVGEGVMSVEGVTSTSSASRHHLRRRV